jgi:hypothetical protein
LARAAEFCAVAGRGAAVVGGSVALDAGKVCPRFVWVTHAKVNPETRYADLRNDLPAALL